MKGKLIVIGCGDHGKIIEEIVSTYDLFDFLGFVDDNPNRICLGKFNKLPYLLKKINNLKVFISITNNSVRKKLFNMFNNLNINYTNIIHPHSIIGKSVKIEKNVFVGANVVINTGTCLKKGVFINTGCIIEHDNVINEFSHLAPGTITGGGVVIGRNSFIGLGSRIRDHVELGDNIFVKIGSIVTKSFLKKDCIISGIPAKICSINKNIRNKYQ